MPALNIDHVKNWGFLLDDYKKSSFKNATEVFQSGLALEKLLLYRLYFFYSTIDSEPKVSLQGTETLQAGQYEDVGATTGNSIPVGWIMRYFTLQHSYSDRNLSGAPALPT